MCYKTGHIMCLLHIPHNELPNAVNHAKLHTHNYYVNVTRLLVETRSASDCRLALRLIAEDLKSGDFKF